MIARTFRASCKSSLYSPVTILNMTTEQVVLMWWLLIYPLLGGRRPFLLFYTLLKLMLITKKKEKFWGNKKQYMKGWTDAVEAIKQFARMNVAVVNHIQLSFLFFHLFALLFLTSLLALFIICLSPKKPGTVELYVLREPLFFQFTLQGGQKSQDSSQPHSCYAHSEACTCALLT